MKHGAAGHGSALYVPYRPAQQQQSPAQRTGSPSGAVIAEHHIPAYANHPLPPARHVEANWNMGGGAPRGPRIQRKPVAGATGSKRLEAPRNGSFSPPTPSPTPTPSPDDRPRSSSPPVYGPAERHAGVCAIPTPSVLELEAPLQPSSTSATASARGAPNHLTKSFIAELPGSEPAGPCSSITDSLQTGASRPSAIAPDMEGLIVVDRPPVPDYEGLIPSHLAGVQPAAALSLPHATCSPVMVHPAMASLPQSSATRRPAPPSVGVTYTYEPTGTPATLPTSLAVAGVGPTYAGTSNTAWSSPTIPFLPPATPLPDVPPHGFPAHVRPQPTKLGRYAGASATSFSGFANSVFSKDTVRWSKKAAGRLGDAIKTAASSAHAAATNAQAAASQAAALHRQRSLLAAHHQAVLGSEGNGNPVPSAPLPGAPQLGTATQPHIRPVAATLGPVAVLGHVMPSDGASVVQPLLQGQVHPAWLPQQSPRRPRSVTPVHAPVFELESESGGKAAGRGSHHSVHGALDGAAGLVELPQPPATPLAVLDGSLAAVGDTSNEPEHTDPSSWGSAHEGGGRIGPVSQPQSHAAVHSHGQRTGSQPLAAPVATSSISTAHSGQLPPQQPSHHHHSHPPPDPGAAVLLPGTEPLLSTPNQQHTSSHLPSSNALPTRSMAPAAELCDGSPMGHNTLWPSV